MYNSQWQMYIMQFLKKMYKSELQDLKSFTLTCYIHIFYTGKAEKPCRTDTFLLAPQIDLEQFVRLW